MMENVQSIASIITVIVLFFALSFVWKVIEKFLGEIVTAFIAIFVTAALIIACIYGMVK